MTIQSYLDVVSGELFETNVHDEVSKSDPTTCGQRSARRRRRRDVRFVHCYFVFILGVSTVRSAGPSFTSSLRLSPLIRRPWLRVPGLASPIPLA